VLGGGVEVLVDHLLQGGYQRFIQRQCFRVLYAFDVAVEGVLDGRAHGDDAVWSRHLHFEVGVVGDGHEFGVAGPPKCGVIGAPEPHHLEGEHLLTEIAWSAEPNRQIDLPEGPDALARHDAMERRRAGPQLIQFNPQQAQLCT
jgi:hypothetical protein